MATQWTGSLLFEPDALVEAGEAVDELAGGVPGLVPHCTSVAQGEVHNVFFIACGGSPTRMRKKGGGV